ncbi:MAG: hypothetical protein ACRC1W_14960 [Shewanella sp.]
MNSKKITIKGVTFKKIKPWLADAKWLPEWIETLRSGERLQCERAFFDPDNGGYCCLGVLAEINNAKMSYASDQFYGCFCSGNASHKKFYRRFGGLGVFEGFITTSSDLEALSTMNDTGFTFFDIADFLEWASLPLESKE